MTHPQPIVFSTRTGLEYDKARFVTDDHDAIQPLSVFRPALSPSGFSALIVRERYQEVNVAGTNTHILVKVIDDRTRMKGQIGGIPVGASPWRAGDVVLIPALAPSQWSDVTTSRILQVHLDPQAVAGWAEEGRVRELRIQRSMDDRVLDRLLDHVLVGLRTPDRLHLEGLALQIAGRLLSHHSVDGPTMSPNKGGLAPWQVRRVQEFLAENLATDIGIEELSAIARLSPFHFARAFKATVGIPPHAYQRQLRMAQACRLLGEPSLSVIEVALSVGFNSPQAFARTFRREFGVTPTDYRRDRFL